MTTRSDIARMVPVVPWKHLRVLDACGESTPTCGLMFSMLGADVLLLESTHEEEPRQDVDWLAYNMGKRSIVANWHSDEGLHLLKGLLADADILVHSGSIPNSLVPRNVNPRLIEVVISPFGMHGPRGGWRGGELIAQAAGGLLYTSGDPSFPPARVPIPIASCVAGSQAAVAAMLALRTRLDDGLGKWIDVSIQEAVACLLVTQQTAAWLSHSPPGRAAQTISSATARKRYWQCKDGLIAWTLWTGPGYGALNKPMIDWLNEEGEGFDLAQIDWEKLSIASVDPNDYSAWQEQFTPFFMRHTKQELAEGAIQRRIMLHPLATLDEVAHDPLLIERNLLSDLTLPDGRVVSALARPFKSSAYDVCIGNRYDDDDPSVIQPETNHAPAQVRPQGGAPGARLPLQGVRILDFSWAVAGPATSKILALYGADVAKVESRKRPDSTRMTGPYPLGRPSMDGSAIFANYNTNKRSLAIDIGHPQARDLILKLGAKADIVLENFSAGVMERHGIGYDDFRAVNSGVIMLSMSLQGQTGSRAQQPGLGNHIQMRSGLDDVTGFAAAEPGGPSGVMPDLVSPWFGCAALLSALEYRRTTGLGQQIDLSQYETMLMWMQPALLYREITGNLPQRSGNKSSYACPHGVYPVKGTDQWIAIACYGDPEWALLWSLLPRPLRIRFPKMLTASDRVDLNDELDEAISTWTKRQNGAVLVKRLQAAGVPAYLALDPWMLVHDEQLAARQHYALPRHEVIGEVPVDQPAFRIEGLQYNVTAAPRYASGSADVLRDWLGSSDEFIADAIAEGVITFDL